MEIKQDPWAEHHKPQKFERTDRSGRWSPIHEPTEEAWWIPIAGGIVFCIIIVLMMVWGAT